MAKKTVIVEVTHYCKECRHSTEDWKFENLSWQGKPTLLFCARHQERKRIINEKACKDYEPKIE